MTEDIKHRFDDARERIRTLLIGPGASGAEAVEAHAADVDAILVDVFAEALRSCDRGSSAGIALVALGGYGRRELTPASDLDLLLLYRGWSTQDVTEMHRALMYPLWDAGRELGDRVREPRDVLASLDHLEEATAFLDARFLAGDRGLFTELHGSVMRRMDRGRATFFADLWRASRDRHERFGHAGHLLEPNLRDSAGGLRDIHTLPWASKLLPGGEGLGGLVAAGHLAELDRALLEEARAFLLRLRVTFHLVCGRHQDHLDLGEQDEVAEHLAYRAVPGRAPADVLMQELYRHAREVDAVVRAFWERITRRRPRRLWRVATSQAVGDGCVLQEGRLEVVATTHLRDDAAGWLRTFLRSIRLGVPLSRVSSNRLRHEVSEVTEPVWSPEAREVFCEILQSGRGSVDALASMDASGLLPALIPEWAPVRCLPQRDPYHRFTVDMHLFAVVAELAASRSAPEPDVHDAWSRIGDADGLFVGALLHDVGKGQGGDHAEIGTRQAVQAARRMGLEEQMVDDVRFVVREHLTLVSMATHRDLSDPVTVQEVVQRVGDPRRLAMLLLLTRADSIATGPEAWSSFRAALVRELYAAALGVLEGAREPDEDRTRVAEELGAEPGALGGPIESMPESWRVGLDPDSARRQLSLLSSPLAPGELRTLVTELDEAHEFLVVAQDRPGLFATVSGALALRGVDVHDAEIYTRSDGVAVEVYRVHGTHGVVPQERWERIRSDILAALSGELDLDEALARKAAQSRRRPGVSSGRGSGRVVADNAASATHTVVEVHALDSLGLLRRLTRALLEAGCDLGFAKVATYGTEVVDVFYVHDLDGRKITDAAHLRRIEESLRRVVGAEASTGA